MATRKKSGSSKRELIDTGKTKQYAKRRADGTFKEMDDVGRSLSADQRQKAKTKVKKGYGDQGDQKTSKKPASKKSPAKKSSAKK